MTSSIEKQVKDHFHYLHNHAEISWEEVETTKFIKRKLEEAGCKVEVFKEHTGVIGKFGDFSKGLPVVGIRADMDALWQEVNGTFQANHSCGHDAHMSMVLGVLWKLTQIPNLKEQVAVKFIFQPAEEHGNGALKMIEQGVVEDVDYLFGVHLRPKQEVAMGKAAPVIVHGAAISFEAAIKGEDAHGARPHLNANAIEVGAHIVQMLSQVHLDPRVPHSVKMTKFQAGGKSSNIIPGNASFSLDLRAQTNQVMNELEKKVIQILETAKDLHGVDIEYTKESSIVAAETNDTAIQIMKEAIGEVLGEANLKEDLVTPGGDDFHFYTIKKPELKATMLGLGCDLGPGLHHPNMKFNEDALIHGVDILSQAIKNVYGL
ncbi:M20 peptidase aminoacylase family protein [Oceanobacillus sp. J11TS1]|uniref:M20 peptidase aminoacylase family protein n=1 Tax=Oceanobacillus sp. J11TS1 TaxID=2807191 RepID=UPI001B00099D|nr:M20 peptidase aminoacylase family protein [Oceanobacillus sp. J11TS1]GIO24218.1 amidohydrolase AmhX [Oceanobacillus sp. J11TS1]